PFERQRRQGDRVSSAGEQAVGRGAYGQALANVEPALEFVERLPEGEERLRAELGVRLMEAMIVTALYGQSSLERIHTSERICQLSEPLGDVSALFRGLLNLGFTYAHRFEENRALEIAHRCVKLVEQEPYRDMLPAAYALLAQANYRAGNLSQAAEAGAATMKGFTSPHQRAAAGVISINLWTLPPVVLGWIELALG